MPKCGNDVEYGFKGNSFVSSCRTRVGISLGSDHYFLEVSRMSRISMAWYPSECSAARSGRLFITCAWDTDRDAGCARNAAARGSFDSLLGRSVSQTALQKSCPRASAFATSPGSFFPNCPLNCPVTGAWARGRSTSSQVKPSIPQVRPTVKKLSLSGVTLRSCLSPPMVSRH
jgi:hypothetical protein